MVKIIVELLDSTPLWKIELLVHLIEDKIGGEEEIREIRMEE